MPYYRTLNALIENGTAELEGKYSKEDLYEVLRLMGEEENE